MKKIRVFGKELSVLLVVGIVMAMGVTAYMVGYLSNSLTTSVDITSPLEFAFNKVGGPTTIDLPDTFGGGEINYTTVVKNDANQDIEVYRVIHEITNEDGQDWDGHEFDGVYLSQDGGAEQDITSMLCYVGAAGNLHPFVDIGSQHTDVARIIFADGCDESDALYTHPADTAIRNDIRIVLNEGMIGSYSMKLCHLQDLAEPCP